MGDISRMDHVPEIFTFMLATSAFSPCQVEYVLSGRAQAFGLIELINTPLCDHEYCLRSWPLKPRCRHGKAVGFTVPGKAPPASSSLPAAVLLTEAAVVVQACQFFFQSVTA